MQKSQSVPAVATRCVVILTLCAANSSGLRGQSVRTYDVQFTTNTIVADGIDSPGEWDGAETNGGDWGVLREPFGNRDTDNNAFRMLWDDTNLYIRWESDKTTWLTEFPSVNPDMAFAEDNINLYFDPNTTGDANNQPDNEVDGYQFSFNTYRASDGGQLVSTDADRSGVGFFTEAHVNSPFGNQANWGGENVDSVRGPALQDIVVGQNNQSSGPDAGGFAEVVIPWTNFNADAFVDDGAGGQIASGLNHTAAPVNGETWFSNLAVINVDDTTTFLPIWNWTPSSSFAPHGGVGHGEITFVGRIPEPSTIALLGLGLVGFMSRRRGSKHGMMLISAVAMLGWSTTVHAQANRHYDVQFTTNTIVADGIDSPGEWDGASTTGGEWNELRQPLGDADTDSNEFRMLWDDTNLYVRWENEFTNWLDQQRMRNPLIEFNEESVSLYFDPNTTGDANNVPDSEVDGYQLAFNTYSASNGGTLISTDADRAGVGIFTEAHVNELFGNQANWGGVGSNRLAGAAMQEIVIGQNNQSSGPDAGGFAEIIIPWANFNADAFLRDTDGNRVATGLRHTSAPANGDVWYANVAVINSAPPENLLPVWNWTPSQFFASHGDGQTGFGHGELTFVGRIPEPATYSLLGLGMWGFSCRYRRL